MINRPDNDTYFMIIAHAVSARATCLRHNVGCVIIDRTNRIVSTGYNGAPAGLAHCLDVGCIRDQLEIPSGEKQEYCRGVHAEQNALIQAEDRDKLAGGTLYCTHTPCLMCIKMILNAKIKRVMHGGAYPVTDLAWDLINEAGIIFEEFKEFDEFEEGLAKKEIDRALAKGKEEADACLAHSNNLPGHYKG